jgi:tetratricopeptide (TPR) repeat protein
MRARAAVAALALMLVAAAPGDEAALLQQLRSGTAVERRAAVARLAEIGGPGAIAELARALRDADDEVRARAQAALWAIWHRSGNPAIDALLQIGIEQMEQGRHAEAAATFGEVIKQAPDFAEGWNKRATVYYLMGEWDRSLADCEEVIRRNPIHWGALAGFGLNYLEKDQLERAVQYFERALAVNPNLGGVEARLRQLREILIQRRRQSI